MRPFALKQQHSYFRPMGGTLAAMLAVFGASLFAAGGVLLLDTSAPAFAQTMPKAYAVPGEIVVWIPSGTSAARLDEIAASAGCDVIANLAKPSSYYLLRLKGVTRAAAPRKVVRTRSANLYDVNPNWKEVSQGVRDAVAKLTAAEQGLLADPNWIRTYDRVQAGTRQTTAQVTPNDTYYPQQWDMRLTNMPQAWRVQSSAKPVIAAVMDSGFDISHPDFKRSGVNNFVTPINVGDPVNVTTDVTDTVGHGTHVAGTVAAVANNTIGIAGVAGFDGGGVNIRILPIKIEGIDEDGNEFINGAGIIAGIQEAIRRGASVINMSFGGYFSSSTVEQFAINSALNAGVSVVASSGNGLFGGGVNTSIFSHYPSDYPGVISVGAVDRNGKLSSYSNYGGNITIVAPGGDSDEPLPESETQILSTIPLNPSQFAPGPAPGYGYSVGTSMSAPHVTGAVALLAAAGATPAEIRTLLIASATPLPAPGTFDSSGTGAAVTSQQAFGAGLLNVRRALAPHLTLLGGEQLGELSITGENTTDSGSTYSRTPAFNVSVVGIGNVLREIGADPAQTSLVLRIETATTPSTLVQTITVPVSAFPAQGMGESPFAAKSFALPIPPLKLAQNRYKATVTLTYRGVSESQTQFFEVLEYNQPTGLTLFSVPFKPTSVTAGVATEQQILGVSTGFSVRRWDPLNPLGAGDSPYYLYQPGDRADAYARFGNPLHTADVLHPERAPLPLSYATGNQSMSLAPIGVGFWLSTSEAKVLETAGVPTTSPVAIPLYGIEDDNNNFRGVSGWNLIGAPFEYPVNWSAVTVRQNTPVGVRDYTLAEAINAEVINAQLVGWDVPTRSYNYNVFPNGQLLPFRAYWVRALRDCTLIVPPSRSTQSLTSRKVATPGTAVPMGNDGWRVRLSASVAGDRDVQNFLGQTGGASDGEDRFDVVKPPTGPGYADVRFLGTDKRGKKAGYAFDMRPLKSGKQNGEWTVAVGAGKGETDVTLAWDGLGSLPPRAKLTLRDTVTGRIVPMNSRSSYTYKNVEAGATRLFTVTMAQQNTAGPLQIRNVRAVPTEGRGVTRGVNVRFGLSQDADVQGTILTLSGKVVSVLSGGGRSQSSGDVQLRWDGRTRSGSEVPAGSYVLEITARTDNGEVTTVKRPITTLR